LHTTGSARRLPKEIAVGLFFAAAIFIPTISREPALRPALLPVAILFGALCSLNCLFIYAWEHEDGRAHAQATHVTTRFAVVHVVFLAGTFVTAATALVLLCRISGQTGAGLIPAACALSATLLLALDRNRRRLSPLNLRAAADLALLTPLLFLPILR
jgi:hypothetical protein